MIDIRTIGLMAGIELEPRPGRAGRPRQRGVHQGGFDKGVLMRVTGDIVALSPPLIIEQGEIDRLVTTIRDALSRIS